MQVLALRWVDEIGDEDIFFDRAVIVSSKLYYGNRYRHTKLNIFKLPNETHGNLSIQDMDALAKKMRWYPKLLFSGLTKELVAPGVFIHPQYVLTSFNPFRDLMRANIFMSVHVLMERKVEIVEISPGKTERQFIYRVSPSDAECAQQIIPIDEDDLTSEQWHGLNKQHSPIHDLMVLRLESAYTFLDPDPKLYSFDKIGTEHYVPAGPFLTDIARPGDRLESDVKFASLGFRSRGHIKTSDKLLSRSYEAEEDVLEDCDEWIPRHWGHFICIRDEDNYEGVGSGALLFHRRVLFGIGSFALKKLNTSILVFTDVRPYHSLLNKTCRPGRTVPAEST